MSSGYDLSGIKARRWKEPILLPLGLELSLVLATVSTTLLDRYNMTLVYTILTLHSLLSRLNAESEVTIPGLRFSHTSIE